MCNLYTVRLSAAETADAVAEVVWRSVTEIDAPTKIPAGADAETSFREAGHLLA
jgi:hypothetical protein